MERSPAPRTDSRNPLSPVKVISVPQGTGIYVKFLGNLRGLLTHWKSGRTVPCSGDDTCPITLHRTAKIFKAYAAVLEWRPDVQRWRPAVLEATANLEEYLRGRKLRGEVWILAREKEKEKTSPVKGAYVETVIEPSLQDEFAIEDVLCRLFNVNCLNLGVPNPLPKKIVLQDVLDPPPPVPLDFQAEAPQPEDPAERAKVRELLRASLGRVGRGPAPASANGNGHSNGAPPATSNGSTGHDH